MTRISWLHLSDLHVGVRGLGWEWPTMEDLLKHDLAVLHELQCGPWDLIFFTGDLSQSAQDTQFEELSKILERFLAEIERLQGYRPILLAVPGNHDLKRPSAAKMPGAINQLKVWHVDPNLRKNFWSNNKHDARVQIGRSFANYSNWWAQWVNKQKLNKRIAYRAGVLPGDFSAIFSKDGKNFGIVGLNSAMLHFGDEKEWNRMSLAIPQIQAVCGEDHYAWFKHNLCSVLLTHHPVSWLSQESLSDYTAHIAPPGRFQIHMFGHMHQPENLHYEREFSKRVRMWQGTSLFGEKNPSDGETRLFGYSSGLLEINDDDVTLRQWARKAVPVANCPGAFVLAPRPIHNQQSDQGSAPERILFLSERSTSKAVAAPSARPAGTPYDAHDYIERQAEERGALSALEHQGKILLLVAPARCGKSTFAARILELSNAYNPAAPSKVVRVTLPSVDSASQSNYNDYLYHIACNMADNDDKALAELECQWKSKIQASTKLKRFMQSQILLNANIGRTYLVIDRFDNAILLPNLEEFLGLLRSFADEVDQRWSGLRIICQSEHNKCDYAERLEQGRSLIGAGSPALNLIDAIVLPMFSKTQVAGLAEKYGIKCTPRDIEDICRNTGGHPYFTRILLDEVKNGSELANSIKKCLQGKGPLYEKLREHFAWLVRDTARMALLRKYPNPKESITLTEKTAQGLVRSGVLRKDNQSLFWSCDLLPAALLRT